MRHRKRHSKLSMKMSHRKAALRNMVKHLLEYQRITISLARAKVLKRLADQMITLGKDDTLNSRRKAYTVLADRDMVGKLFKEIAPLFKSRPSGYTRIIPLGFRRGDGASMCMIELTEKKIVTKLPKKKKAKAEEVKAEVVDTKKEEKKKGAEAPKAEQHKESKKAEPKIKSIPKSKPTLDEEKRTEKAKSEDRKLADKKGFMKNIRGLFRKRGDF